MTRIKTDQLYEEVLASIDGQHKAGDTLCVGMYAWAWRVHANRITPIFREAERLGLITRGRQSTAGNIIWERTNVRRWMVDRRLAREIAAL